MVQARPRARTTTRVKDRTIMKAVTAVTRKPRQLSSGSQQSLKSRSVDTVVALHLLRGRAAIWDGGGVDDLRSDDI